MCCARLLKNMKGCCQDVYFAMLNISSIICEKSDDLFKVFLDAICRKASRMFHRYSPKTSQNPKRRISTPDEHSLCTKVFVLLKFLCSII